MAQDIIDIHEEETTVLDPPLVVCKGCGKVVPKTNLCIYCGAPILYRGSHS